MQEDENACRILFEALRGRVLRALPVPAIRIPGRSSTAERGSDLDIRDEVQGRFLELLCADRIQYEAKLDFFEIRFNLAIAKLRSTAREKVNEHRCRYESVALDADDGIEEIETLLAKARDDGNADKGDFLFRSKLFSAISTLPADERQAIELILQGRQIESQDSKCLTIDKILGCTPKTVRNRRKRAIAMLRAALKEDDDA